MKLLERNETRKTAIETDSSDAIVVLSGMIHFVKGTHGNIPEWSDAADRFFAGVELCKVGKARQLIFTGALLPWSKDSITEGSVLKHYAIEMGIPEKQVQVTQLVETTTDEAIAVRKLLGTKKKITLVTSAFHMYRAKWLFEQEGFLVSEFAVDFKSRNAENITIIDFLPYASKLEITEIGFRELIGRLFYRLVHQPSSSHHAFPKPVDNKPQASQETTQKASQ